jgi:NADP-dependent 3-hydroxy acid dehydrogenase YdfG
LPQAAADVWCRAGALGVVVTGRRVDKLDEVAQQLRKKHHNTKILAIRADVTNSSDMEFLFSSVRKEFGRAADVVLANAGVMEKHNLIADQDVDAWWNSMVGSLTLWFRQERTILTLRG